MTMPKEIHASIKKLIKSFILFQSGLLVVAAVLSLAFTGYFKNRLAGQLSAAVREPLMAGDNRLALVALPNSMSGDFSGVSWRPSGEGQPFEVPEGISGAGGLFLSKTPVKLFFDEAKTTVAGVLYFYYPRWTPVAWAFFAWLVIALLSVPLARRERNRLVREYQLMLDLEVKSSQASLAAQVAHDIRSPLAAIGAVAGGLRLSGEERALLDGSLGRMRGIADDLLKNYRAGEGAVPEARGPEPSSAPVPCLLAPLVGQALAEKRVQHNKGSGLKLELRGGEAGIAVLADPKELQRMLSNLLNNSIEALGNDGTITVDISGADGRAFVEIRDNGKGIPPAVLARLGRKGETYGKTEGNGLGLYHAKTSMESWGGGLELKSETGKGTAVTLNFVVPMPAAAARMAVLLDDDPLVHLNWKLAAKNSGVELKPCKSPADLEKAVSCLPKDTPLYIDSELGGGVKGEHVAAELHARGFTDISLATGHAPEKFNHLPWLKVTGKEPPFGPASELG